MNKKALIRTISQELTLPLLQDKITMVLVKAVEVAKRTLATGEMDRTRDFDGEGNSAQAVLFTSEGRVHLDGRSAENRLC